MLSDPDRSARVVYRKVKILDDYNRVIQTEGYPWEYIKTKFLQEMVIPHQGVFHHFSLFKKRKFDINFRYAGDYEFLLPEVISYPPMFVNHDIAAWSQGGATSAPQNAIAVLLEMKQARMKHNIAVPIPLWLFTNGNS